MKKIRVQLNVVKVQSYVMLVLPNVTMESLNVRKKKKKEPTNMTKVWSHVMLVLPTVMMELSNLRKKIRV